MLDSNTQDIAATHGFIEALFSRDEGQPGRDGRIEIAIIGPRPAVSTRTFANTESGRAEAVKYAARGNSRKGANAYFGIGLRSHQLTRRASKTDFVSAPAIWIDLDDSEAALRAAELWQVLPPTYVVTTGTAPALRLHAYWVLTESVVDGDMLEALVRRAIRHFSADEAPKDRARVMRLPGLISWAKPDKAGRIDELVTYETTGAPTTLEAFSRAYPGETTLDLREAPVRLSRRAAVLGKANYVAMDALIEDLASTCSARNSKLTSVAYTIGGLLERDGIDMEDARARLMEACERNGYAAKDPTKMHDVIERQLRDGVARPLPMSSVGFSRSTRGAQQHLISEGDSGASWRFGGLTLVRDGQSRPIWNVANAISILQKHETWRGVFGHNVCASRPWLLAPVPGDATWSGPRPLRDTDYTLVWAWFSSNGFPKATSEIVTKAVDIVCASHPIDPLLDWLDGLSWDGTPRLATWLCDYAGVQDTDLHRAYAAKTLISLVARIRQPGCKVDSMLILEGAQGAGKSTLAAALCPEASFFGDALPTIGSKDASSYLRGKLVVEFSELASFKSARGTEELKAYLTRTHEKFRPSYGRHEIDEPRRCIFIGTTNEETYLTDTTGARRFWPVKVGDTIDLAGFAKVRDPLIAEADCRLSRGETWWLDGGLADAAKTEQVARVVEDPWVEVLAPMLEGLSVTTAAECFEKLQIPAAQRNGVSSPRMSAALRALGFEKGKRISSGPNKGRMRFHRGSMGGEF